MSKLDKLGEWKNPGKVFITGASAGIGASYAKAFAENGFDLVLLARRKDRLQALANLLESDCSIHCEIITADLSEKEDIKKAANHIRQIDNLDMLINNAGFATIGCFADIPIEKSMRMFHTHMTATVQFTHAALQVMIKRKRGAIINVSSMGAFTLTPGNVLYDATKSFIATFSENLWLEVRDKGIKVQALCPGFTRTEFHEVGDFKNFDKSSIPDSLWMMPDEVVWLSLEALEKVETLSLFLDGKTVCLNGLFSTAPLSGKAYKKESKIGIYEQTNKKKVVNDVVLNPVALGLACFHFLLSPCRSSSMPDRRKFIHLALCCTGII